VFSVPDQTLQRKRRFWFSSARAAQFVKRALLAGVIVLVAAVMVWLYRRG
jgi:hypothetical protein